MAIATSGSIASWKIWGETGDELLASLRDAGAATPRKNMPIIERPPRPQPGKDGDLIRKIDREEPWPPPPAAPGIVASEIDEEEGEEEGNA